MSTTAVAGAHKRVVEQANQAFSRNDMEAFLNLCIENVEWTMVGESTVKGKPAIREWLKSMEPGPPTIAVDQLVAEGDTAVVCGSVTMKNKEGRSTPFEFCDVYRFEGDRIASLKAFLIESEPR